MKGKGEYPYLRVQLLTGFSYMAALLSGIRRYRISSLARINYCSVWFLRALKLHRVDSPHSYPEWIDGAPCVWQVQGTSWQTFARGSCQGARYRNKPLCVLADKQSFPISTLAIIWSIARIGRGIKAQGNFVLIDNLNSYLFRILKTPKDKNIRFFHQTVYKSLYS